VHPSRHRCGLAWVQSALGGSLSYEWRKAARVSGAVNALSSIGALALWGFGVWWLIVTALLLWHYLRAGRLPYGIGWWAFTFPLGAYTVSTLTLARMWKLGALEGFGAVLFILLAMFWTIVILRTLMAIRTGEAWRR